MKFVYYPLTRVPIGVNNLRIEEAVMWSFHSEGVYLLDTIITKYTQPLYRNQQQRIRIGQETSLYKPFGRFMRVIGWKHAPSAALSC